MEVGNTSLARNSLQLICVYHANLAVEDIEVEICVIINGLLRGVRGEIVTGCFRVLCGD
jgi:hypothetical protein